MSSARAQKGRFVVHKKQRAYLVTQALCRKAALQIILGKKHTLMQNKIAVATMRGVATATSVIPMHCACAP